MSIFTSTTSNPKKIKEFEQRLKEAAAFHLKYKPKLVDGPIDTCVFCGTSTYIAKTEMIEPILQHF